MRCFKYFNRHIGRYIFSCMTFTLFYCTLKHALFQVTLLNQSADDLHQSVREGRHQATHSNGGPAGQLSSGGVNSFQRDVDRLQRAHEFTANVSMKTSEKQSTIAYKLHRTDRYELRRKTSTRTEFDKNGDEQSGLPGFLCITKKLGFPDHVSKHCDVNRSSQSNTSCARLTCHNILNDVAGADDYRRIAAEFNKSHPVHIPSDKELASVGANCGQWHKLYGFDSLPPVSSDEEDFPIAFNILAHRDAHQVARLLRAIYRPHNAYCVHIDANSPKQFQSAINSLAACFKNVRLASKLERVVYAGFSRLQADINCMKDHLSSTNWRYLINTAAQAFPLQTNAELVKILRLYNGSNDIEGLYGSKVIRRRFENEWIENIQTHKLKKTRRRNPPPPHNITIVRGSAYGVFSRQFVKFIVEDQRARDLLEWSKRTYSPDELYWSTLHHTYANPHLHTPGAFSGFPSEKDWLAVYANWFSFKCHGKFVHYMCVFGVGDLAKLVHRKELFVNKFHVDFEPLALDCMEAWHRHKETCPPPFDYNFYSKLAFIPKPLTS